jgi:hypothetical protein
VRFWPWLPVALCSAGLLACGKPNPSTEAQVAVDAHPAMILRLQPLSPDRHEFTGPAGLSLNRYFTLAPGLRQTAGFGQRLRAQMETARDTTEPAHALQSVYVEEQNVTLNGGYTGNADSLRGVHDASLVAYARWTGGTHDLCDLIEDGMVVYDLLLNRPVKPPFEFD